MLRTYVLIDYKVSLNFVKGNYFLMSISLSLRHFNKMSPGHFIVEAEDILTMTDIHVTVKLRAV